MNGPLVLAGVLAVLGAGVHGVAGELLVVRRLAELEPTRFGGPRMTKAMVHVTWHITTAAFLVAGVALIVAGTVLDGEAARTLAVAGAVAATAFAAVMLALGGSYTGYARGLLRHPGPAAFALASALAWWGALTTTV